MKKLLLVLSIIFAMLTFAGAFYVLSSNGMKSAGYAAVPMVLCIACLSVYRHNKDKE